MKRMKEFMQKYSLTVLGVVSAFVVTIANTSSTACAFVWLYEEDLPECLKN